MRDLSAPFVRCILIPAVGGEIATELANAEQERLDVFHGVSSYKCRNRRDKRDEHKAHGTRLFCEPKGGKGDRTYRPKVALLCCQVFLHLIQRCDTALGLQGRKTTSPAGLEVLDHRS